MTQADEQDAYDADNERVDDAEYQRDKSYISDQVPTDQYRYKLFRMKPNAETDYRGIIDKDLVLANIQNVKPDVGYLQEVVECIVLIQQEFVIEKDIILVDEAGNPVLDKDNRMHTRKMKLFDDNFEPTISFLRAILKFQVNSSRAMGKDREAILDKSEFIGKSTLKGRTDQQKGVFGTGGNKT